MLALPLVAGEGERHWARRPVAVLMVSVIALTLAIFTHLGAYTPWSPIMEAWTADPIPPKYLEGRTPLERQGALVLQDKQCRNCHSLAGAGGQRGPALDAIASRMTQDQIIRQVLQGGGNMPAYGNALSPSDDAARRPRPRRRRIARPHPRRSNSATAARRTRAEDAVILIHHENRHPPIMRTVILSEARSAKSKDLRLSFPLRP
jgi:hypothetical protein